MPDRTEAVRLPVELGANHGYFAYPSISPGGDLIAWGFASRIQEDRAYNKARYSLGLYSLTERKWKTYGDFDEIGATAFSADGSKIAFVAQHDNKPREYKRDLFIFDVAKETWTSAPCQERLWVNASLGWSPDAKRLAVNIDRGDKGGSMAAVLDLDTGSVHPLGQGSNPSWSPSGEWISYYDPSGSKCLLVRPDGTSLKTIRKLSQSAFSYRRFGYGGPVWSPDSRQILLSEMKGDGDYIDVVLVNVETGQVTKRAKNCLSVFGWASSRR